MKDPNGNEIKVDSDVIWYDPDLDDFLQMKVTLIEGDIITINDGFTETQVFADDICVID